MVRLPLARPTSNEHRDRAGHAGSGALSRALAILPLGLLQSGLESGQDAEEPSQDEVAIVELHGRDSGVGYGAERGGGAIDRVNRTAAGRTVRIGYSV